MKEIAWWLLICIPLAIYIVAVFLCIAGAVFERKDRED